MSKKKLASVLAQNVFSSKFNLHTAELSAIKVGFLTSGKKNEPWQIEIQLLLHAKETVNLHETKSYFVVRQQTFANFAHVCAITVNVSVKRGFPTIYMFILLQLRNSV